MKIGPLKDKTGVAKFGGHCSTRPLKAKQSNAKQSKAKQSKVHYIRARTKGPVGVNEAVLARARAEEPDPDWRADYRTTRPKVERKLGHLMRRRHGGRRARVRGKLRVGADFSLLAGAANLARLAKLGARSTVGGGWVVAGREGD